MHDNKEINSYARRLQKELNDFVGKDFPRQHEINVIYDNLSGMIQVNLTNDLESAKKIKIENADGETAKQLEKVRHRLRKEWSQWIYFDRNLRIYEGRKTYIFKPIQRFHWTESQAMFDASEIIVETLSGAGDKH